MDIPLQKVFPRKDENENPGRVQTSVRLGVWNSSNSEESREGVGPDVELKTSFRPLESASLISRGLSNTSPLVSILMFYLQFRILLARKICKARSTGMNRDMFSVLG